MMIVKCSLGQVTSARIGKGLRSLPSIKGFHSAATLMWRPFSSYARIVEPSAEHGVFWDALRLALTTKTGGSSEFCSS